MSAKISGMVWELDLAPMEKFVLLAYADHADHLGHNVRPSLKLICRKTRLKERAVQYIVQRLRAAGYMIPVRHLEGGRGHTTEYRIALPPEPPGKGAPDDTLSATDLSEGVDTYAHETSLGKGAPDDTLSRKGAPDDTLSSERVHVATGKGAPDDRKGAPGCTPIPRSQILNPPPPTSPEGEEHPPDGAVAGGNGSAAAPTPAAYPWERPAFPGPRQPWDKPVPPAIAACGLCDDHGMVDLLDAHGVTTVAYCCHHAGAMQAFAAHHGYRLVREDRSREPPPPPEGGPAP